MYANNFNLTLSIHLLLLDNIFLWHIYTHAAGSIIILNKNKKLKDIRKSSKRKTG